MDTINQYTPKEPANPTVEEIVNGLANEIELLEILAAIKDGAISHEDLDPGLVRRMIDELGPDELAEHLGYLHPFVIHAIDDVRESPIPFPTRQWRLPTLLAIAASLLLVAGVALVATLNRPQDQPLFTWSSQAIAAAGPLEPLPIDILRPSTIEPDWDASSGIATLGPADVNKRQLLQRATVILRDSAGMGSGVLISGDGWILTNYHVVSSAVQRASLRGEAGQLDTIIAVVKDGRLRPSDERPRATVYRVDPAHDLALLKLNEVPTALKPLSFVTVAKNVPEEGDEVIAIGSPGGLAPWNMRSGEIARIYEHPAELSENVGMPSRPADALQRVRAEVIQTDIGVSAGDSGGPLLAPDGRLVGITFATPANLRAGAAGLHIALPHLQSMIATLPDGPEVVPPDLFAAADPALVPVSPRSTADGGIVEAVVWPYVAMNNGSTSRTSPDVAAVVVYIDTGRRNSLTNDQPETIAAMMPRGLWTMEDRGLFRFTMAILRRTDGLVAVATTNADGVVSEVRLNREGGTTTSVAYIRQASGKWQLASSLVGKPLSPAESDGQVTRIRDIWNQAIGNEYSRNSVTSRP